MALRGVLLGLILMGSGVPSLAQQSDNGIYIKVGEAQIKKSTVAFTEIQMASSQAASPRFQMVTSKLQKMIQFDLDVTGFFEFMDPKGFLEDVSKVAPVPVTESTLGFKFDSWSTLGVEVLIRSNVTITGDKVAFDAYVYYVPKLQKVLNEKYRGSLEDLPQIAHRFANDLIKALTGKEGMFLSKIVASVSKPGSKVKEIYTMDWDGGRMDKVTAHNSISLSPNWSPDGRKIIYTAFVKKTAKGLRNPDMFLLDLDKNQRWSVSDRMGLNSGGFFHPDGQSILLTMSKSGSADIYRIDVNGNIIKKLTNGPNQALNVEPSVSPDGKKLAFSSDRSGRPMIWVMDMDGSSLVRRTFAGVYNSSPSWSPDGEKIAFAGLDERHYDIFIMKADGSQIERLTSARRTDGTWSTNEDPVFSPDGRHVMFTSDRTGTNQIYIVNVDGTNERRITFDRNNYYKPRWSKNFDWAR